MLMRVGAVREARVEATLLTELLGHGIPGRWVVTGGGRRVAGGGRGEAGVGRRVAVVRRRVAGGGRRVAGGGRRVAETAGARTVRGQLLTAAARPT
jgi:hypothetical protein